MLQLPGPLALDSLGKHFTSGLLDKYRTSARDCAQNVDGHPASIEVL